MFLKDKIRGKNKVINILLGNFLNCIPEHSNYIKSKHTEVSPHTKHQPKNNIQISIVGNNHRTIIASDQKKDENHKKLNINQLNNSTCEKTHVNSSNNNEEEGKALNEGDKKSEFQHSA